MRFDDVFEGIEAGAALRTFTAGAAFVDIRHVCALAFFGEMLANFFIAEGMAKANNHCAHCSYFGNNCI